MHIKTIRKTHAFQRNSPNPLQHQPFPDLRCHLFQGILLEGKNERWSDQQNGNANDTKEHRHGKLRLHQTAQHRGVDLTFWKNGNLFVGDREMFPWHGSIQFLVASWKATSSFSKNLVRSWNIHIIHIIPANVIENSWKKNDLQHFFFGCTNVL